MKRLAVPFAVAVFSAAVIAAFSGRWPWHRPMLAATPITVSESWLATADTLKRGETIGDLFARQGVTIDLSRLTELGFDTRRLRAGLVFKFQRPADEVAPSRIEVRTGPEERVRLEREESAEWELERETILWTHETVRVTGIIESSLYAALDSSVPDEVLAAGERMKLAWDLADVYAWSVDFTRDLQPADRFAAVIERRVSPEGEVRYGRVLAASLELSGKTQTAIRFAQDGREGFYDASGTSLRRAFLAAPVEFRRISSRFSRARFHPILRTYRAHTGIDYAASAGTPVMAAGEGTIAKAGWSGGYGLLVEIRHRSGVTTRYAHLRALGRGIKPGVRVSQGETVGYVGSTGLATAAHLHYEFRVNGAPQDPRRVRIEEGPPIAPGFRPAFDEQRDEYARLLTLPARRGTPSAD